MGLLIISLLTFSGLITTIGLLAFHTLVFFSKSKRLLNKISISLIITIVTLGLGSRMQLRSIFDQPEKYFILITIIINYLCFGWFIKYLLQHKKEYLPYENVELKRSNKIALILYFLTIAIYLLFSIGWLFNWMIP